MPGHPPASAGEADIVIAGAGPTGLMLAIELRLGGVDAVVLEPLTAVSEIPKGNGLVGQIVPVLDYRGLLDRLRQEATWAGTTPQFSFGPLLLDFAGLGTSPLHILTVPQRRLEKVLEDRLAELGGTVRRGHELTALSGTALSGTALSGTALSQDDDAVTLDVRGPAGTYQLRARYLVGCDGAHSLVRKQAGIGFPGVTSSEISRIGQVRLPTAKLARGGKVKVPGLGRLKLMGRVRTPRGTYSLAPLAMLDKNAPAGVYIVYTSENDPAADLSAPMTLDELRTSTQRVLGGDLAMTDPQRLTRLAGNSRLADRYLTGRVLLAGDAAHVFGLSLNAGLLDAVNLGWKLAAQVQGRAPRGLLDSYQAERHLAGLHSIRRARAETALTAISEDGKDGPGEVSKEGAEALRELFGDVLAHPEPLRHIRDLLRRPGQLRHLGELIEGSDVRYPMPAGSAQPHPLLGRLVPDLQLETSHGSTRVAELMHAAQGVLLDLTADSAVAAAARDLAGLVTVITARCLTKPAPAAALLIRPDGQVAWACGPDAPDPAAGLENALHTWFSPRATNSPQPTPPGA